MRAAWLALLLAAGRWGWLAPASAILFGVAGLFLDRLGGWVVPIAIVATLGTIVEFAAKRSLAAQVGDHKALLFNGLNPLARTLVVLVGKTTPKRRREELPNVLWMVLVSALILTSVDGVRASFFYRTKIDKRDCLVPHPTLTHGRGDEPVSQFFRDSGEGKAVWEIAETGLPNLCEDIDTDPPEGMNLTRDRSYKTFVTAPVMVDGAVAGLLTINAPNPGDLTEDDKGVIQVLARISGVAIALCDGMWVDAGSTKTVEGGDDGEH